MNNHGFPIWHPFVMYVGRWTDGASKNFFGIFCGGVADWLFDWARIG